MAEVTEAPSTDAVAEVATHFDRVVANVEQVIKGKDDVVRLTVICLLAGGHLLIEDVPGVGKTSLARALAASIDGTWSRIQFTPDLLPSDVTGVTVYDQSARRFEFHPGGVFANVVLADEINRASPKTQSALLEVMDERRVTVDAVAHPVPLPFMVVATQNPIEMDGTYRLPEAQLDRFLMRTAVGYPAHGAELEILAGNLSPVDVDRLMPVISTADVARIAETAAAVHVAPAVADYIVRLGASTRSQPDLELGASPRASLAIQRAARAAAAAHGRRYVVPEDVKAVAHAVLGHRLILTAKAAQRGARVADIVQKALDAVPTPTATAAR